MDGLVKDIQVNNLWGKQSSNVFIVQDKKMSAHHHHQHNHTNIAVDGLVDCRTCRLAINLAETSSSTKSESYLL
ncbi:hypothetical protein BLOT_011725 [Blomia tropicalis]|nr:hypothetical protein BLOT_011725 [Blomia tropicalis]